VVSTLGLISHCLPNKKAHVSIDREASNTGLWTECPSPSSTLSSHIEALTPGAGVWRWAFEMY